MHGANMKKIFHMMGNQRPVLSWHTCHSDLPRIYPFNLFGFSGHYVYRTVVTVCTAQWSLCVPHSGHCIYRTVVIMCTAQWSLCVPHSGHCMYRTVVNVCTAQWSLCVPHSGHCMYRTMVTICTTRFNVHKFHVRPTQCIYVFCLYLIGLHWGRNKGWGCLRIGCRGEYLGLRGTW